MNKIIKSLSLNKVGLLELLIALFPILLPFLYIQILALLLCAILANIKTRGRHISFKPYRCLIGYILLHELVLFVTMDTVPSSYFNLYLQNFIYFVTVLYIVPGVNMEKLEGAVNLVTIVCIVGMFYQATIVATGGSVMPLIYMFGGTSETFQGAYLVRPMSFFLEPSNYAVYMLVPLFLAMLRKNYAFVVVIILSIFLSTSTTGLATAFIIPLFYILTEKSSKKSKFLIVIIMGTMGLALLYSSFFSSGVEKVQNTDLTTNVRLAQGPEVVRHMPISDYFLGCNYATPYDYYKAGKLGNADVVLYGESLYMTTFWYLIAKFGVIGLFLYLYCYVGILRKNKVLMPFVLCSFVLLFTSGKSFSGFYIFEIIFLLVMTRKQAIVVKTKKV